MDNDNYNNRKDDSHEKKPKRLKKIIKHCTTDDLSNLDLDGAPVQMKGVGNSNVILIVVNKDRSLDTAQISCSSCSVSKDTTEDDLGDKSQITDNLTSLSREQDASTSEAILLTHTLPATDKTSYLLSDSSHSRDPPESMNTIEEVDEACEKAIVEGSIIPPPGSERKEWGFDQRAVPAHYDGNSLFWLGTKGGVSGRTLSPPMTGWKDHVYNYKKKVSPPANGQESRKSRSPPYDRKRKYRSETSPTSGGKAIPPGSDKKVQSRGYNGHVEDLPSPDSSKESDLNLLFQNTPYSPWGPPHRTSTSGLQGLNFIYPSPRLQANVRGTNTCYPVPQKRPDATQDNDCDKTSSVFQGDASLACCCQRYCPCMAPCAKTLGPCYVYQTFPVCCLQSSMTCLSGNGCNTADEPREKRRPFLNMSVAPCPSDHSDVYCYRKSLNSKQPHDCENNAFNRMPPPMGFDSSCNSILPPMGHDTCNACNCNIIPLPMGNNNACNCKRISLSMGHDTCNACKCNKIPPPKRHDACNACNCNKVTSPNGHVTCNVCSCNRLPPAMGHDGCNVCYCNRIPQPMGHDNACNCNRIPPPVSHNNACCNRILSSMGPDNACNSIPSPENVCCPKPQSTGDCSEKVFPSLVHDENKKNDIKQRPPTIICYICGQEYGTASIEIHEKKCLQRWKTQNSRLPTEEQRPEPAKPIVLRKNKALNNHNTTGTTDRPESEVRFRNVAALESIELQYVKCHKCSRTFLPDRLKRHLKGCMGFHSIVEWCVT